MWRVETGKGRWIKKREAEKKKKTERRGTCRRGCADADHTSLGRV